MSDGVPETRARERILADLTESIRLKQWVADQLVDRIADAATMLIHTYRAGGKVLFCGNGGSAADSQHLAAELVGRFRRERRALPALALTTDTSILTALGNDFGFERVFLRQVEALLERRDLLVGLSTSGRSANVNVALRYARQIGAATIALAGGDGGDMAEAADLSMVIPSQHSARVQECHIAIGHILCELAEEALAGG